jgi:hypothetical protein
LPPFWDDTYRGRRWRYGLFHGPASSYLTSTKVSDMILQSARPSSDPRFREHGTAEWPRELPIDVVRRHSLIPLGEVQR